MRGGLIPSNFNLYLLSLSTQTKFLAGFAQVLPKGEKAAQASTGHQERLSSMWARLLVTLSFSVDGQALIIRTPGMSKH